MQKEKSVEGRKDGVAMKFLVLVLHSAFCLQSSKSSGGAVRKGRNFFLSLAFS